MSLNDNGYNFFDSFVSKENWNKNLDFEVVYNKLSNCDILIKKVNLINKKNATSKNDFMINNIIKLLRLTYEKVCELIIDLTILTTLSNLENKDIFFNIKSDLNLKLEVLNKILNELSGVENNIKIDYVNNLPNSYCFSLKIVISKYNKLINYLNKIDNYINISSFTREIKLLKDKIFEHINILFQLEIDCYKK